ncbi:tyrosine recombinase XerS [Mariprofundus micogutta]|uniref:Tyrosine recombinase XerS n=1 Tax=Mariprofundus micogutta TaxID=1921010 RepID=A0A1L8CKC1_9PROT|nr:site-specific integrase [Mariprofundus micogutta]GAV19309.1 tyrosine recombinase XerS [Mariprofundus micogutta]
MIEHRNGAYRVRITRRIAGKNTLLFSETFNTETEAKAVEAAKKLELKNGQLGDYRTAKQTTLSDILQRYSRDVVPHISRYPDRDISKINNLRKRSIASIAVAKIEPKHFAEFRDERRQEKGRGGGATISKKTIKEELSLMHRVLEHASAEWGVTLPRGNPVNVRSLLKLVRDDAKKRQALKRSEKGTSSVKAEFELIRACRDYNDGELANFVRIAIETACRRNELVTLQWENVNINKRIMTVRNKDPMNRADRATRKVPLSRRVIATLRRIGVKKSGNVFTYTHPDTVTVAMRRACKKAGIEKVTPHQLRHEATTRAQAKGWTPAQVMVLTGHETTQMLDNYGHMQAEDIIHLLDKKTNNRNA